MARICPPTSTMPDSQQRRMPRRTYLPGLSHITPKVPPQRLCPAVIVYRLSGRRPDSAAATKCPQKSICSHLPTPQIRFLNRHQAIKISQSLRENDLQASAEPISELRRSDQLPTALYTFSPVNAVNPPTRSIGSPQDRPEAAR